MFCRRLIIKFKSNKQSPGPAHCAGPGDIASEYKLKNNNIISDFYNCRDDMFNKKDIFVQEDIFIKSMFPTFHSPTRGVGELKIREQGYITGSSPLICSELRPERSAEADQSGDQSTLSKGISELISFDFNLNKLNYNPNTIRPAVVLPRHGRP